MTAFANQPLQVMEVASKTYLALQLPESHLFGPLVEQDAQFGSQAVILKTVIMNSRHILLPFTDGFVNKLSTQFSIFFRNR